MKRLREISLAFLAGLIIFSNLCFAEEDYILGPGDKIKIEVVGEEKMTTETEISPQGIITFWMLGDVKAADKKLGEFKQELTNMLADKYIQNPIVKVEIKEYRSKEVVIQGAVDKPGTYYLDTNWTTIIKMISTAGGAKDNVGTTAYIVRGYLHESENDKELITEAKEHDRIEVNLQKLLQDGDLKEDKQIYGGDFIFISSTESESLNRNFVWVEGQVKTPGKIPFQIGLTALGAIIQAGDFTEFAAPNRTTITRTDANGKTETIKVKVKNIRKGKAQDVPLKAGDRVSIKQSIF
jgi:polysaccharide biosynthesis/export protein